jgi:hypothetical protein
MIAPAVAASIEQIGFLLGEAVEEEELLGADVPAKWGRGPFLGNG